MSNTIEINISGDVTSTQETKLVDVLPKHISKKVELSAAKKVIRDIIAAAVNNPTPMTKEAAKKFSTTITSAMEHLLEEVAANPALVGHHGGVCAETVQTVKAEINDLFAQLSDTTGLSINSKAHSSLVELLSAAWSHAMASQFGSKGNISKQLIDVTTPYSALYYSAAICKYVDAIHARYVKLRPESEKARALEDAIAHAAGIQLVDPDTKKERHHPYHVNTLAQRDHGIVKGLAKLVSASMHPDLFRQSASVFDGVAGSKEIVIASSRVMRLIIQSALAMSVVLGDVEKITIKARAGVTKRKVEYVVKMDSDFAKIMQIAKTTCSMYNTKGKEDKEIKAEPDVVLFWNQVIEDDVAKVYRCKVSNLYSDIEVRLRILDMNVDFKGADGFKKQQLIMSTILKHPQEFETALASIRRLGADTDISRISMADRTFRIFDRLKAHLVKSGDGKMTLIDLATDLYNKAVTVAETSSGIQIMSKFADSIESCSIQKLVKKSKK